jgi:hypothetical protein
MLAITKSLGEIFPPTAPSPALATKTDGPESARVHCEPREAPSMEQQERLSLQNDRGH